MPRKFGWVPVQPEIEITVSGNSLTATDGVRTRHSSFANPAAAKSLATRLKNDRYMAAKWLTAFQPVQLDLPFDIAQKVVNTSLAHADHAIKSGGLLDE